MNVSLLTSQEAIVPITGADDATPPNARSGAFSAQVAPFPAAYTAVVSGNQLHFVPTAPGDYTVTITAHSLDGTALPVATINFSVTDTPPPSQATHVVLGAATIKGQDITTPANPGTDTTTGSF